MPLFEFKCEQCEHRIERLMKHEQTAPICDVCEKRHQKKLPMKRLISRTSFKLEGTGWARDGYGG